MNILVFSPVVFRRHRFHYWMFSCLSSWGLGCFQWLNPTGPLGSPVLPHRSQADRWTSSPRVFFHLSLVPTNRRYERCLPWRGEPLTGRCRQLRPFRVWNRFRFRFHGFGSLSSRETQNSVPQLGARSCTLFWGKKVSPTRKRTTEKSWYPYSNLSTGGPRKGTPKPVGTMRG